MFYFFPFCYFIGILSGYPLIPTVDEKIKFLTPLFKTSFSKFNVPTTLFSKYFDGSWTGSATPAFE